MKINHERHFFKCIKTAERLNSQNIEKCISKQKKTIFWKMHFRTHFLRKVQICAGGHPKHAKSNPRPDSYSDLWDFSPNNFGALRIFVWIPGKKNTFFICHPGTGPEGAKAAQSKEAGAMEQPPARHPPYR